MDDIELTHLVDLFLHERGNNTALEDKVNDFRDRYRMYKQTPYSF